MHFATIVISCSERTGTEVIDHFWYLWNVIILTQTSLKLS